MSSGPDTLTFPPNPTPFGFRFTNIDEKMELGISSNVESGKDEIEDEIKDFTPSEGRPTSISECREIEVAPVKVRRPSDYNPSLAATLGLSQPSPNLNLGAVGLTPGSAGGLEGPDCIFVGGILYYFNEGQARELLELFGQLQSFDLVKDRETGNSKGYAFCVYQDISVTEIACAALNGIKMGDKTLTVRRANTCTNQPKLEKENALLHTQQQIAIQRLMLQPGSVATKVVCLTQVVTPDELKDDDEYEDILEDMREEAGKFGKNYIIMLTSDSDI